MIPKNQLSMMCKGASDNIYFECDRERERTGSPTATLRREILLTPALSFTPSLNVSLGKFKLPYEVPDQKNNRLNKKLLENY